MMLKDKVDYFHISVITLYVSCKFVVNTSLCKIFTTFLLHFIWLFPFIESLSVKFDLLNNLCILSVGKCLEVSDCIYILVMIIFNYNFHTVSLNFQFINISPRVKKADLYNKN